MRIKESFQNVSRNMIHSVSRYPLTILFLIAVAILNGITIEQTDEHLTRLIYTSLVGAMLSGVAQTIDERFGRMQMHRYLLMLATVVLTIGYYFAIGSLTEYNLDIIVKTSVALFALMIAFIWIPTIDNPLIPFHRSFLSAIKAFFTALLFLIVLALGISAIFTAINNLLFELDFNLLTHLLNPLYTLFAPIFFLSFAPQYQADDGTDQNQIITDQQFIVPRFFEVLLSYIIIPLVAIYTLILVLYVFTNITGDFWSDNLIEPLLVSYAVIVIIVLILSYNIDNRFAVLFRKVFPKILVPIVVFQTIASILKIREMGITHGRYYVILFGVFATVTGLVFSFLKPKYHGYIAAVLLVLATISIVPPVDAFTVSKNNQIALLEEALTENEMISDNTIVPNPDTPTADRIVITNVVSYIQNMGYEDEIAYLPKDFEAYSDFNQTFGFNMTYARDEFSPSAGQYFYLEREENYVFDIGSYDVMLRHMLYHNVGQEPQSEGTTSFEVNGEMYELERKLVDDYYTLIIKDFEGTELLSYPMKKIVDTVFGEFITTEYVDQGLDVKEATFETENDNVRISILLISLERATDYNSMEFYIMIDIKE